MEFRRARNFLGLNQILVSVATGISINHISAEENGRLTLNRVERSVLEGFYRAKLRILAEAERESERGGRHDA